MTIIKSLLLRGDILLDNQYVAEYRSPVNIPGGVWLYSSSTSPEARQSFLLDQNSRPQQNPRSLVSSINITLDQMATLERQVVLSRG